MKDVVKRKGRDYPFRFLRAIQLSEKERILTPPL
jgi:hypothetical protein